MIVLWKYGFFFCSHREVSITFDDAVGDAPLPFISDDQSCNHL
jgi:hypothetical protein